jgi:hypothetical protein
MRKESDFASCTGWARRVREGLKLRERTTPPSLNSAREAGSEWYG